MLFKALVFAVILVHSDKEFVFQLLFVVLQVFSELVHVDSEALEVLIHCLLELILSILLPCDENLSNLLSQFDHVLCLLFNFSHELLEVFDFVDIDL